MKIKFGLYLIFLIFMFASVEAAAIGVTPAKYELQFKPNFKGVFSFEFVGSPDDTMGVYVDGELAKYSELNKKTIKGGERVDVYLKLPNSLDRPGTHYLYVGATESGGNFSGIGIIGSIRAVVKVNVPYPGNFIETEFSVNSVNFGDKIPLTLKLKNLGDRRAVTRNFVNFYYNKEKIKEVDMGTSIIEPGESEVLIREINSEEFQPGIYLANAVVKYEDKVVEQNVSFRVGELYINITNYSRYLVRDRINKFEIDVESYWKNQIDNVYANVTISDYSISFLTPSVSIKGFEKSKLVGYFDTAGIDKNKFNAVISLHYEGKETRKEVTLEFAKQMNYAVLAVIIFIITALIMITIMIIINKKRKKLEVINEKRKK